MNPEWYYNEYLLSGTDFHNEKDLGIIPGNMSGISPFIELKFNPFKL